MVSVKVRGKESEVTTMARITVLVCDRCQSQDNVKHYEIKHGAKKATLDLCNEHNQELEACLVGAKDATQRRAKRRVQTHKPTTMEQIEALKNK